MLQAHACLTDKARRRAFDAERATAFCAACLQDRSRTTSTAPSTPTATTNSNKASTAPSPAQQQQPAQRCPVPKPRCGGGGGGRMSAQALREVQNRLRDEWRVIDGCLRANNSNSTSARRQSFPLFDPSDHRRRIPDYPHARPSPPQHAGFPPPFERQDQTLCRGFGVGGGAGICESPVYQVRTAPERAARTKRPW